MITSAKISRLREGLRWSLPKEHGSWSLALEPLVLGLGAAPSSAGAALAVTVLAGFLLRRPVKLLAGGGADSRRRAAIDGAVIWGFAAVAGLVAAAVAAGPTRLWPLLAAIPPGAMFLWFDSRGEARQAAAELAGVVAFAAVPAALASAAGWSAGSAAALAVVMACRSIPAVMTIRTFLRRRKGLAVAIGPALIASLAAVIAAGFLSRAGLAPWTAPAFMALLLGRAVFLLGRPQLGIPATKVGIAGSAVGGILVLVLALSWSR